MKIVVLDGYTLNPGDLSWEGLEALGEVMIYDRTPPEQIVERSLGAEVVLTNKTPMTADTMAMLPDLRYIGVLATGFNVVDIAAARERNITVTNIPTYGTSSVAQFGFALLLELCHHVGLHHQAVSQGKWASQPDFCFSLTPLVELAGKTMGIVGFGRIGQQTAQIAAAFGMKIVVTANSRRAIEVPFEYTYVDLPELLACSDVVSLNCPLTPSTEGMIHRDNLALMKSTAFLINTSRGGLIVEQDLADALNAGRIAGAGLDVLSLEPPNDQNPLLSARNCVITPHIAWATQEARARLMEIAVQNLKAFIAGVSANIVN